MFFGDVAVMSVYDGLAKVSHLTVPKVDLVVWDSIVPVSLSDGLAKRNDNSSVFIGSQGNGATACWSPGVLSKSKSSNSGGCDSRAYLHV